MTRNAAVEDPIAAVAGTKNRWVSVGRSIDADSAAAGREAARGAMRRAGARLIMLFCSDSHALEELLAAVLEVTGGTPLIGCTTAGEMSSEGPGEHSVVVAALGGTGFSIATARATGIGDRLREAGAEVAGCVQSTEDRRHKLLILLTDGLAGDQQDVVRGAYSVAGPSIPLVGGSAGDDLKMVRTAQFHDSEVLFNAVVGAAIASDSPMGVGVRHGWRRVGDDAMLVTRSEGNFVYTFDDEPALDVYLRKLGAPSEVHGDPVAFNRFSLIHPLGLSRRNAREARTVALANFKDRSLWCYSHVPQGSMVWFMEGDRSSMLEATDSACEEAIEGLDGADPIGFLAFDCVARLQVLGQQGVAQEVSRLAAAGSGAPLAGFYTYGEIARTHGITGFHNQTLVVLALS